MELTKNLKKWNNKGQIEEDNLKGDEKYRLNKKG